MDRRYAVCSPSRTRVVPLLGSRGAGECGHQKLSQNKGSLHRRPNWLVGVAIELESALESRSTSCRGVAQPGSAPALGAGGPRFKSARPDHLLLCFQFTLADTVCIRGDEGLYWLRISSKPSLKWRHSDLNQGQRASHVSWSTIEFRNESSTSLAIAAVDKGERDLSVY